MSQLTVLAAFLITVVKKKRKEKKEKLLKQTKEGRIFFGWQFERTQCVLAEKHGRSMVLAAMVCAKACYISVHQEAKRNQVPSRALL